MAGTRRLVCLAMLTSVAACSSGGGGGGGGPGVAASGATPAASPAGGSALGAPSTNFQQPMAAMSNDGSTLTMSTDPTAMTVTSSGSNTAADPDLLTVHVAKSGIAFDQTFNLTAAQGTGSTDFFASGNAFQQATAGRDRIVFDNTLSFSEYGIWQHNVAADGTAQATGAFSHGQDTPAAAIPTSGTATYTGGAIGYGTNGTANFGLTGTSVVTADFGNRVVGGNINLTPQDNTGTAIAGATTFTFSGAAIAPNSNHFAGTIASTGTSAALPTIVNGNVQGSFFGPTANEAGGVFAASGGKTSVVAAFGGHQ